MPEKPTVAKKRIAVAQHISNACACPFYATDVKGKGFCFIKNALPLSAALNLVEDNRDVSAADWKDDCLGSWDNCTVLPLLYDYSDADVDPNARDVADDYDPFGESDDDEEEAEATPLSNFTPPAVAAQQAQARAEEEEEEYSAESLKFASSATFSIHQVEDPYRVKCDAVLIPVNNLLESMDLMLIRHCGSYLDSARNAHRGPINMGNVYPIKSPTPAISAKQCIYRGVVAGVQSVNAVDIEESIKRTLHLADSSGIEVLAMVPMDYAGYDIELTAQAQISTVYEFLVSCQTQHLKHIIMLIQDDVTMDVFEEYQTRIFEN